MDSVYCMLQQIRKRPGLYLGEKSLSALGHFMAGYVFRNITELWMEKTGLEFSENYDFFTSTLHYAEYHDCLDGFCKFVHAHYNVEMGVKNSEIIILEKSSSQEEAFDKHYELLDIFFAEQRKKVNSPDKGFSGDVTT